MVGLGFGLLLGGYTLLAYGWSQVRGCNAGLAGLIWPGAFKGCNPDSGSIPGSASTPAATAPSATNPNPVNPITAPPVVAPGGIFGILGGAGTPVGPVKDTPFGGGSALGTA